jgi:site-specific recombinase XerD
LADPKPITIPQAYEIFMLDAESRRFTQTTLAFYRQRLMSFVRWCQENNIIHLQDITAHHIRSYFVSLQQRQLSDWSQNAAGRAIKTFLARSVEEGLLNESPAKRVKLPKIAKRLSSNNLDEFSHRVSCIQYKVV